MTGVAVGTDGTGAPSAVALAATLDRLEGRTRFDTAVAATAVEAQDAAVAARALGLTVLELRAELVAADVRRRTGQLAEAARTARDVHRWATEHDAGHLLARSHFLLAAVFQELGDLALALEHAVHAVDLLADDAPVELQIDHRVRLADCLGLQGDAGARDRYADVLQLAEQLGDVDRLLLILNNSAYTATLAGEHTAALAASTRLQDLAHQHGVRLDVGRLDTVARVLIGLGRLDDAEAALRPGLDRELLELAPDGDAGADFLLTHAEVQRTRGLGAAAQASLDECIRRCEQHGLTSIRVRARREQAELHAAGGDYRAAYTEHVAYVREVMQQQSQQRDARARTLQAVYETTEARRQTRRYRELSLRDPLTGLYNRRYVDERLAALHGPGPGPGHGPPVEVALLDLDHFKAVNDTCSHEVGDEVLRRVADLLGTAVPTEPAGSFAARMGGEEFLLVLVGLDASAAGRHLEQVRAAVADQPWALLTGTVPVTVSIGSTSTPATTPAELLGRADGHLYRAKSEGRNRVVTDAD